jgi:hypothetical protein
VKVLELETLKVGYYVELIAEGKKSEGHFKVTGKEPFKYTTGDEATAVFSTVADAGESGFKNIELLEPSSKPRHLFQVLWGVKDGCTYYIKIATGTDRLGVDEDRDIGYIDNEMSPYYDPDPLYKFWLIENWYPSINAKNSTGGTVTPKVWFKGMKYDIEKVPEGAVLTKLKAEPPQIPCKQITLGGVRTA